MMIKDNAAVWLQCKDRSAGNVHDLISGSLKSDVIIPRVGA